MADLVQLRGGRKAGYEVIGDGEPLLMFMGGPGFPAELTRRDAELAAGRFASFMIDPHGSGNSTPPECAEAYDNRGHAAFYDEVRQALGLGRVSVHGVSFGGTVALTYAALFPERTVRSMAVSAFAFGTDADEAHGGEAAAEMEAMLVRHAGASWYPQARATWDGWNDRVLATPDAGEVEAMFGEILPLYCANPDEPGVAAGLAEFRSRLKVDLAAIKAWESGLYETIDLGSLLGDIECPTLVVAGELDLMCGPAQARGIARAVAGAEMVVIPDCGHFPAMESPSPYQRAILDWDVPR